MEEKEIQYIEDLFDDDCVLQEPMHYEEPGKLLVAVFWARYALSRILGFVAGLFVIVLYFGAVAIHLWTIIIAFLNSGFIASFMTLLLPVISQIYWAWRAYAISGTIWNNYIVWIGIYIISCIFTLLCGLIAAWLEGSN